MRLTDQKVRGLPRPETGQRDYTDDTVPGLYVRIGKSTKTFRLTIGTGARRRRLTLGRYPELSLAGAREKARDILAKERLQKTETPRTTFSEALELYYRLHFSTLRPHSQRNIRHALDDYFRPKLGRMILADVKRSDIAPILDTMYRIPSQRRASYQYVAAFLHWCVGRGYMDLNPTDRMDPPKAPDSRERILSPGELAAIWLAAPESDYGRIVKLCILSGQRRDQWAACRREYALGDRITWPKEAMKAGRSHTLPLTPSMKSLLPERIGLLFPTSGAIPFNNWTTSKKRLDRASGVTGWTHHDLRRTWATVSAEELGTEPHIIEAVLAHVIGTTVARTYNRARYVEPMRRALMGFEEWLKDTLRHFAAQRAIG